MSVVVVISQHLLNVFVQLANKRGLKKNISFVARSAQANKILFSLFITALSYNIVTMVTTAKIARGWLNVSLCRAQTQGMGQWHKGRNDRLEYHKGWRRGYNKIRYFKALQKPKPRAVLLVSYLGLYSTT
jgi:hypothetical protein